MPDLNRSVLVESENADTLGGLTDVTITAAEEFQGLSYNGTQWVNSHIPVVSYVRNAEANTLTTGTVVYLFGGTGDHATVKRADNSSDATSSKTLGIVANPITASQNGPVVTRGYVDGIDLSVGYSVGDILWLNTNGTFTTTKPTSPAHLVFVGVVARASVNGIIYVAVQNGYELNELHDVNISNTLASGDFLKYNGSTWVNGPITLGTDTTGNYVATITGTANEITVTGSGSESAAITLSLPANVTIANNLTVTGDLTVNGNTTTLNTANLNVEDNFVLLNSGVTGSPSLNAGVEVERGDSTNVAIRWNETTDKWQFSNDGTNYTDFGTGGGAIASPIPMYTTTLTRTNLVTNPSFETNTTGWTVAGTGTTIARITTDAYVGSACVQVNKGAVANGRLSMVSTTSADRMPVTAGQPYYASAYVKVPSGQSSCSLRIRTSEFRADGTQNSAQVSATTVVSDTDGWVRLSFADTPTGGATPTVTMVFAVEETTTNARVYLVDGCLFEQSSTLNPYFDGTNHDAFSGYTFVDKAWTSTADASTSTSTWVLDSSYIAPTTGSIWLDSDTGQTYVYYDSSWIEVGASSPARLTISASAPSNPIEGSMWLDSDDGATYAYYNGVWIEVGASAVDSLLTTINAKGDLLVGTADNTVSRLAAGTDGYFLKANSNTATGLEWNSIPTINNLDDIGDVSVAGATNGKVLQYNGSAWVAATVSSDVMTDSKNAALLIMDIGA